MKGFLALGALLALALVAAPGQPAIQVRRSMADPDTGRRVTLH